MNKYMLALLTATTLVVPAAAQAAVTVTTYAVSGTFASGPYTTLSGTFATSYDDVTRAFTLTAADFKVGNTSFTGVNTAFTTQSNGAPNFFGSSPKVATLTANTDGFWINVYAQSGVLKKTANMQFGYSTVDIAVPKYTTNWTITPAAPAVPEPASWAMMIAGFGLTGTAMRRPARVFALIA
ncbi:PEPxxWA-CTERM sorting domain-containing protein [Sphingomonas sp. ID0503]|uniref:PEPxxWA-CTERM sorting domain-containing protein n=1 Tax=Sphingomonas sp. ID0503 TaxID=3399691 RepID=UPI003AFABE04